MSKDDIKFQEDYKYGFKDEDVSIVNLSSAPCQRIIYVVKNVFTA